MLLVKTLIVINPQSNIKVGSLPLRSPLIVRPGYGLLEMLALFRKGHCHLALVADDAYTARNNFKNNEPQSNDSQYIGIVTMEDVVEEILQEEIVDETDIETSAVMGVTSRSRVLHNGVVLIKSNRSLNDSRFATTSRTLTNFTAHNPQGALLFDPPVSISTHEDLL